MGKVIKMSPNLTGGIPKVGEVFVFSHNNRTGDWSYLDDIWECVAITETQIWAKSKLGKRAWLDNKPICLIKSEHDYFPVDPKTRATLEELHNV